jgi:hypothetical protein
MSDTTRGPHPIHVALTGTAGLTADLVRHLLAGHSDIALVDEPPDAARVLFLAGARAVDVVVATGEDGVPEPYRLLLFSEVGVPVIAVHPDGRLVIYDRLVLREAAPDELLAEIRRVAARRVAPPLPA